MVDLNDVKAIRALDSMGSLITTENYDKQFKEGLDLVANFELPPLNREIHEIILLGTGGGSSVAGGFLRSYLFDELKQPIIINQGYNIPAFVDKNTLVLVTSHSGNTEEILSAYEQAKKTGAYMVALTAGGKLAENCKNDGVPCLIVPADIGHPRRDLGYIFVPLLVMLHKLGLISDKTEEIMETINLFTELNKKLNPEVPVEQNHAKQIAIGLYGHIPLIYGSLDYYDSVAWRWKNQFGENSKLMAFYNVIPNLHHDEAVGWDMPEDLLKKFYLIMLRDDELDSPKIKKRKDITADILKERMGHVEFVYATGKSRLARMFSLVYLGDFVTLYAPIYRGVDPTPVEVINLFKRKMAE
ncbi:bifunctional phosphoglucose/phosphomannose isomerase [Caldanaerobius fijiensis DSM 17918]|uniref:Bifunctional phosphoglucose/phosphomannose isomerase n=1 Tax=Caldanaerobius fijiensis DSM 17918 TaxID=1121256 RepID=A0A1M5CW36_9THEO|nr:bifunctional phosphoglucose/phosphomannose isomerase [Caldanaerobius fijiensis]SHF58866.1 bifunctional phosphoglucose/phosphomannose isomerase [Caldanaerobius fijiensis DSM 17918]